MKILSPIFVLLWCSFPFVAWAGEKPNIVYILADDLGYGDVGCYNPSSKIATPFLDRLAQEGMRFTDAHAPSGVCTPSRYALMTGRYAWRSRLQKGVLAPFDPPLIDSQRLTVPTLLRQQGYGTACIGKWHLGWDWPKSGPDGKRDFTQVLGNGPIARGFDSYFGTDLPNYPPYCFIRNDRTVGIPSELAPLSRGGFNRAGPMLPGWKLEEILPAIEKKAVQYIEESATIKKPFFLYLPLTSPHYPIVPSRAFQGKSGAGAYGDFVMQTDYLIGQVLDALRRTGAENNTLVIFTSDNGPEITGEVRPGAYDRVKEFSHSSMGPFRGAKRDAWEGGHRVPFLARWPGKIKPGSVTAEPVCHVDFMATVAAILQAKLPADAGVDSYNMLPILMGQHRDQPLRPATIHHSANGKFAIRQGHWVLILAPTGADNTEPAWYMKDRGYQSHQQPGELYDIKSDPGQRQNLYSAEPEKVRELAALVQKYVVEGRSTPGPKQVNDVEIKWDKRSVQRPKG